MTGDLRTALAALRARRMKAAEDAERLASEIDRVDGTPTAMALRRRLAGVAALVNELDRLMGRRGGRPPP